MKELFSTHLIVFWAVIREYQQLKPEYDNIHAVITDLEYKLKDQQHTQLYPDESLKKKIETIRLENKLLIDKFEPLEAIYSKILSLLRHGKLINKIIRTTRKVVEFDVPQYSTEQITDLLDITNDVSSSTINRRLPQLQRLYMILHKYFMQQSGNFDSPRELAQDEGDYLFNKEIELYYKNLSGSYNQISDLDGPKGQKTTLPPAKKDYIKRAEGDDHIDLGYQSDDTMIYEDGPFQILEDNTSFEVDKNYFEYLLHHQRWSKTNLGSKKVEVYRLK